MGNLTYRPGDHIYCPWTPSQDVHSDPDVSETLNTANLWGQFVAGLPYEAMQFRTQTTCIQWYRIG